MLVGSIGSLLAPHLAEIDPSRALTVVLVSYIAQGLGFFMGYLVSNSRLLVLNASFHSRANASRSSSFFPISAVLRQS
jgi:hypothetical protein